MYRAHQGCYILLDANVQLSVIKQKILAYKISVDMHKNRGDMFISKNLKKGCLLKVSIGGWWLFFL